MARSKAALRFQSRNQLVESAQVGRVVHLGHGDRVHPGADRGLEVARRHGIGPVDAHRHVGPAAPHPGRGLGDEPAGVVLLVGGDAVLQIEQDAVRAARMRLFHVFLDVHRNVEQRAPHWKSGLHS